MLVRLSVLQKRCRTETALTFTPAAPALAQDSDLLDGTKAGKSKSRADDSQASKNAAALNAADAAKKRAEALIAEAMSQARTSA